AVVRGPVLARRALRCWSALFCSAPFGDFERMLVRTRLTAAAALSLLAFAVAPSSAQSLRYANQGDLKSLDPYTLRESTTIAHHGHVYEGLTARDKDLSIIPSLAESWET